MLRNVRPAFLTSGERARYHRLYAALRELDDYPWRDLAARRDEARGRLAGSAP